MREVARGDKPYLRKSTDRKAQIRKAFVQFNYGPGTRDGASGFDRAVGTVASLVSCSFVVEEFDRRRCDASMADQQEDEPRPRASPDSERLLTTSGDDLTVCVTDDG